MGAKDRYVKNSWRMELGRTSGDGGPVGSAAREADPDAQTVNAARSLVDPIARDGDRCQRDLASTGHDKSRSPVRCMQAGL